MNMKRISVLLVLIAFFFTASANDGTIKKNKALPAKNIIQNINASATKQPAIEQKDAQVKMETKKVYFDCWTGMIFYCAGEYIHLNVTITGGGEQSDCTAIARAIADYIQQNFCGEATNV
jgi:hypothetical protein